MLCSFFGLVVKEFQIIDATVLSTLAVEDKDNWLLNLYFQLQILFFHQLRAVALAEKDEPLGQGELELQNHYHD